MREITIQVVLKLNETTDATARILEASARDWANGQLFDSDETASVAIIMDRELDPLAKIDRLTRALVSVPKDDDEEYDPKVDADEPAVCLAGNGTVGDRPCGDPDCPCCPAPPEQCYDCGAVNEDASKPWATETVDADPGDPEVGPQPHIMDVSICPACHLPGWPGVPRCFICGETIYPHQSSVEKDGRERHAECDEAEREEKRQHREWRNDSGV